MPDNDEFIDEEPLTPQEIEKILWPIVSRNDRREFLRILRKARLIVFRADSCYEDPA